MTAALAVACPAKVNLALRVLDRRGDGFHELATVYQTIDLWDRLEARPADGFSLSCSDPRVPTDASNLVLRAASLLAEQSGVTGAGLAFRLDKRIPLQAGLGGGSSDAAGALVLCARLWELSPDPSRLAELAARLGSDVPFFLVGGTALGTGRGERVRRIEAAVSRPLLIGVPGFGIPTPTVYARVGARLTLPANTDTVSSFLARKWLREKDFGPMVNDLESVVLDDWPELAEFRNALIEVGAGRALLSGSGSSVFGVFAAREGRDAALDVLDRRFPQWRLIASHTVPLGVQRLEPTEERSPGG